MRIAYYITLIFLLHSCTYKSIVIKEKYKKNIIIGKTDDFVQKESENNSILNSEISIDKLLQRNLKQEEKGICYFFISNDKTLVYASYTEPTTDSTILLKGYRLNKIKKDTIKFEISAKFDKKNFNVQKIVRMP